MTKAQEFRDQSIEELGAKYDELRKELYEMVNIKQSTKKLDKPHLVRAIKKDIARVLTIIGEKQAVTSKAQPSR